MFAFVLLALALPFVSAIKPIATQSGGLLTVEFPDHPYYLVQDKFDFYWHVFNSTGFRQSAPTVNCTIHVYNSSGTHVLETIGVMDGDDYEAEFGSNISNTPGFYSFILYCDSKTEAGWLSDYLLIANSDADPTNYLAISIILVAFVTLMFVVGFSLDKEHAGLKLFMIWLGTILFVPLVQYASNLAVSKLMGPTIIPLTDLFNWISIFVAIVVSALLMIYVLKVLLNLFQGLGKTKPVNDLRTKQQ